MRKQWMVAAVAAVCLWAAPPAPAQEITIDSRKFHTGGSDTICVGTNDVLVVKGRNVNLAGNRYERVSGTFHHEITPHPDIAAQEGCTPPGCVLIDIRVSGGQRTGGCKLRITTPGVTGLGGVEVAPSRSAEVTFKVVAPAQGSSARPVAVNGCHTRNRSSDYLKLRYDRNPTVVLQGESLEGVLTFRHKYPPDVDWQVTLSALERAASVVFITGPGANTGTNTISAGTTEAAFRFRMTAREWNTTRPQCAGVRATIQQLGGREPAEIWVTVAKASLIPPKK